MIFSRSGGIAGWVAFLAMAASACAQEKRPPEKVLIPGSKLEFELVYLPGGTFPMGSTTGDKDEAPVREMSVESFWMSSTEVTWDEFMLYYTSRAETKIDGMTRPSEGLTHVMGIAGFKTEQATGKYPVHSLRWHAAMGYCGWLSKKTGHLYRLPTEAEWEYACRAGGAPIALKDQAWGESTSGGELQKVRTKKPNAWGIYDMLGNALEYTLEPYHRPEYGPVLRGGYFASPDADLRASKRYTVQPDWYETDPNRPRSIWWLSDAIFAGFRVVRVPEATEKERDLYRDKIEIAITKHEERKSSPASGSPLLRIGGEVKNGGDRTLDELELTVYYLTPKGQPHYVEVRGADKPWRATYGWCHPVLVSSATLGEHREPLKPGARRAFELEIPLSFDPPQEVDHGKFGAHVSALRFARP
jgi:formylglycine-generating enzyme required for sulfatase activity